MKLVEQESGTTRGLWLIGALLAVVVSLAHFVRGPLTGDDDYVIHNLASRELRDILFAYNVDLVQGEGGQTTWYEGFEPLQRRYVRIVPSALMAIEYRVFGSNPIGLKAVSLGVHLLTLILAHGLLRRYVTNSGTAALVVALVGLHPSAAECVGWFACQPILFAGLASMLAAHALLKLREQVTPGRRTAFVAAATSALFSYEAAVGIPLFMVALDWWWSCGKGPRRPTDRWATLGVIAAYPLYGAVSLWNRFGASLTDASYRAGFSEFVDFTRADLTNYVVKLLPMPPYGPGTYAAIGSWPGAAVVAAVVGALLFRMGSSRTRALGLLTFTCTLAPSLLTRAALSVMNFPTLRQLYLPLAGAALLLVAGRRAGFGRAASWIAAGVVAALVLMYQALGPVLSRSSDRAAHQKAAGALTALLQGDDARTPIVQVGQSDCGYSLDFDARGREVWKLVPPTANGGAPLLRALDETTVEVRASEAESLAFATSVPVENRPRRMRAVPALLKVGRQRLGIVTAHMPERRGEAVTGFRLTFDRPLAAYTFITVAGCVDLSRWRPVVAGSHPSG